MSRRKGKKGFKWKNSYALVLPLIPAIYCYNLTRDENTALEKTLGHLGLFLTTLGFSSPYNLFKGAKAAFPAYGSAIKRNFIKFIAHRYGEEYDGRDISFLEGWGAFLKLSALTLSLSSSLYMGLKVIKETLKYPYRVFKNLVKFADSEHFSNDSIIAFTKLTLLTLGTFPFTYAGFKALKLSVKGLKKYSDVLDVSFKQFKDKNKSKSERLAAFAKLSVLTGGVFPVAYMGVKAIPTMYKIAKEIVTSYADAVTSNAKIFNAKDSSVSEKALALVKLSLLTVGIYPTARAFVEIVALAGKAIHKGVELGKKAAELAFDVVKDVINKYSESISHNSKVFNNDDSTTLQKTVALAKLSALTAGIYPTAKLFAKGVELSAKGMKLYFNSIYDSHKKFNDENTSGAGKSLEMLKLTLLTAGIYPELYLGKLGLDGLGKVVSFYHDNLQKTDSNIDSERKNAKVKLGLATLGAYTAFDVSRTVVYNKGLRDFVDRSAERRKKVFKAVGAPGAALARGTSKLVRQAYHDLSENFGAKYNKPFQDVEDKKEAEANRKAESKKLYRQVLRAITSAHHKVLLDEAQSNNKIGSAKSRYYSQPKGDVELELRNIIVKYANSHKYTGKGFFFRDLKKRVKKLKRSFDGEIAYDFVKGLDGSANAFYRHEGNLRDAKYQSFRYYDKTKEIVNAAVAYLKDCKSNSETVNSDDFMSSSKLRRVYFTDEMNRGMAEDIFAYIESMPYPLKAAKELLAEIKARKGNYRYAGTEFVAEIRSIVAARRESENLISGETVVAPTVEEPENIVNTNDVTNDVVLVEASGEDVVHDENTALGDSAELSETDDFNNVASEGAVSPKGNITFMFNNVKKGSVEIQQEEQQEKNALEKEVLKMGTR